MLPRGPVGDLPVGRELGSPRDPGSRPRTRVDEAEMATVRRAADSGGPPGSRQLRSAWQPTATVRPAGIAAGCPRPWRGFGPNRVPQAGLEPFGSPNRLGPAAAGAHHLVVHPPVRPVRAPLPRADSRGSGGRHVQASRSVGSQCMSGSGVHRHHGQAVARPLGRAPTSPSFIPEASCSIPPGELGPRLIPRAAAQSALALAQLATMSPQRESLLRRTEVVSRVLCRSPSRHDAQHRPRRLRAGTCGRRCAQPSLRLASTVRDTRAAVLFEVTE